MSMPQDQLIKLADKAVDNFVELGRVLTVMAEHEDEQAFPLTVAQCGISMRHAELAMRAFKQDSDPKIQMLSQKARRAMVLPLASEALLSSLAR